MTDVVRLVVHPRAIEVVERAAIQGYEARGKEERLGILLGRVVGREAHVLRVAVYRGGRRTRTTALVDPDRYLARVDELRARHNLRYLGPFHTHVEVAGQVSSAPSQEDRAPIIPIRPAPVEMIVAIWASPIPPRPSRRYLAIQVGPYRLRIASYLREGKRLTLLPTLRHECGFLARSASRRRIRRPRR